MNEVDEFEGMKLEIASVRRLIYIKNKKEEDSVFYNLEGIENPQEISLRHLHNVLNGFRYLNTINLSTFKYAEYARAIELIEKIDSSLDALLLSESISGESKDMIISALSSLTFKNPPKSLQGSARSLAAKVDLVTQHTRNDTGMDPGATVEKIPPNFLETLFKRFIKFIDGYNKKGPKENDIFKAEDKISNSYQNFKREDEEKAAAEAAAKAAREAAEKAAKEAEKSLLEKSVEALSEFKAGAKAVISQAFHRPTDEERQQKQEKRAAAEKTKKLKKVSKISEANVGDMTKEITKATEQREADQRKQEIKAQREQRKLEEKQTKAAKKIKREERLIERRAKKTTPGKEERTEIRATVADTTAPTKDTAIPEGPPIVTPAPATTTDKPVIPPKEKGEDIKDTSKSESPSIVAPAITTTDKPLTPPKDKREDIVEAPSKLEAAAKKANLSKTRGVLNLKKELNPTEAPTKSTEPSEGPKMEPLPPKVSEKRAGFFAKVKKAKGEKKKKEGPKKERKLGFRKK